MILIECDVLEKCYQVGLYQFDFLIRGYAGQTIHECIYIVDIIKISDIFKSLSLIFLNYN